MDRAQIKFFYQSRAKDIVKHMDSTTQERAVGWIDTFGNKGVFWQPYMGKEFIKDIADNNVVQTVYVECGWKEPNQTPAMEKVAEADMAIQVNKEFPKICNGVVAHADLRLGNEVEPALEAYSKITNVKGIRFSLAWTS